MGLSCDAFDEPTGLTFWGSKPDALHDSMQDIGSELPVLIWEFPKIGVPYFGVLNNKDPTI